MWRRAELDRMMHSLSLLSKEESGRNINLFVWLLCKQASASPLAFTERAQVPQRLQRAPVEYLEACARISNPKSSTKTKAIYIIKRISTVEITTIHSNNCF